MKKESTIIDRLAAAENLSKELADFLKTLVQAGYNICITGKEETTAAKTTILNALEEQIPSKDRVIVIEDNTKLSMNLKNENLVRMKVAAEIRSDAGTALLEQKHSLYQAAMRMRPDWIVLEDAKGKPACRMHDHMAHGRYTFLTSVNAKSNAQGMETITEEIANAFEGKRSPDAIMDEISCGLDILVQVERMGDASSKVTCVSEVLPAEHGKMHLSTLYQFVEDPSIDWKVAGVWKQVADLQQTEKLELKGLTVPGMKREKASSVLADLKEKAAQLQPSAKEVGPIKSNETKVHETKAHEEKTHEEKSHTRPKEVTL